MNTSKFKSFEDLPMMLNISDVANALGIGLSKAYELSRQKSFPAFTVGTRRLVPKEKFLAWIECQMTEKVSI